MTALKAAPTARASQGLQSAKPGYSPLSLLGRRAGSRFRKLVQRSMPARLFASSGNSDQSGLREKSGISHANARIKLTAALVSLLLGAATAFGALSATFNSAYDVGTSVSSYTASGTLMVNLNYSPTPWEVLLLVRNTGAGAISGTFTGLAEGSTTTATYGGNMFTFRISYVGGTGNDITLMRVAGAGQVSSSNNYLWAHLAGSPGGPGSLDATGAQACFNKPASVAVDSAGNAYVADTANHTIRKMTPAGVVTTLAGSASLSGSTDGTGSAARFNNPKGVAVDSAGNVFVADTYNHTIRKVTPAGVVTTLAGSAGLYGSTDGTGSDAQFSNPEGVAVDNAGNVYVADTYNNTIRKVTPAGVVTTLAGSSGLYDGSTDGTGSAARFFYPSGVAVDSAGNVYVADSWNHTIRKVTSAGVVTTLAGSAGLSGSTNGTGSAARFDNPEGVAVDNSGNVYVADTYNNTIRKVTPAGVVTTLAGSADYYGTSNDGTGAAARFHNPEGLAVDSAGNVYVADSWNHTIRKVTPAGVVTSLAGLADLSGSNDGTGIAARFHNPEGVAVDSSGNAYLADSSNDTIRKVTPAGVVTTLAGSAGLSGSTNGTGSAARFNNPSGVAVDSAGNVYVADTDNHTIRKVTPAGVVTTLAGSAGLSGSTNGTGSAARFASPKGVAVDSAGNVYVADTGNRTIRKVTPAGVVSTLAGSAGLSGSTDGTGSAARFASPSSLVVDSAGNVFVADTYSHTIRKVTQVGIVTTLAGSVGLSGSTDGTGNAARFNNPSGVAADSVGNIYVADTENHTIRKVTPAGVVTTIGGLASNEGSIPGYGSTARFSFPRGVTVSASGRLYVTDDNHRVVNAELAGFQPILTQGDVSGLGVSSVTLNGTVNPNGFVTTASFEYGTTQSYGSSASVTLGSASGTTAQNVSTGLTGLSSGTLYYYRLTATNVDGTAYTSGGTFTTISNNADLSNLSLSSGILTPVFASATTTYTASVANATPSITVTPTLAQANATLAVRINAGTFVAVSSGSSSSALPLNLGTNPIELRVTAQDGVTQKTYTVTVTRLALVLNPTISGWADVPVTLDGFVATGTLLGTVNLGFGPVPQQELLLVNNTGAGAISGTFTGLAEGATLTAIYGGNTFNFRISYAGGDGNDITLTRVAGTGQVTNSNTYVWTHLAGSIGGPGSQDATGALASFNLPNGVAVDNVGNAYVADTGNHTIRKVTPAGVVTTLAGSPGLSGSTDGTGSAARFDSPQGVAVDSAGNVYVADYNNHTIRKVTPAGVVTTLAGSASLSDSTDGAGSAARFNSPQGVAVDSAGNVYVADTYNNTIRKVTPAGVVTTLAGSAGLYGSADGTGSDARFAWPKGVTVDSAGNVYVADFYNLTIRKVTQAGVVTTLAGSVGLSGSTDGTGSAARFSSPTGVAVDSIGNVYVADYYNHTIRKVTQAGIVTTLAGTALTSGSTDGTGSAARFSNPWGVAVDSAGSVFVADRSNHTIRKVTSVGEVITLAGTAGGLSGSSDGTGSAARFNNPGGVAADNSGNVYVADTENHTIRKVTPAGVVTTLAGSAGFSGSTNGTGSAARFNNPAGVAVDSAGNVYVADTGNNTIRKVTPAGVVTTLAGGADLFGYTFGSSDGTGSAARFTEPRELAVDGSGNVYVADTGNHKIRKVTPAGVVTTLAGSSGLSGSTDGTGSAAGFRFPSGVAVDSAGNVYVADSGNTTIRKLTPAGVVTTLAGSAGSWGSTNGTGSAALFNYPQGVAVDSAGNVYVADTYNHTIRKVTPAGVVTTLAGLAGKWGWISGSAARFSSPRGMAVSASGRIYVTDANNRLVRNELAGFQPILTQSDVSGLGVSSVTLNGTINPNGFVTTASFEYGTTQSYGSSASVTLGSASGTTAQNVSTGLTGLSSGTLYYYRLTATNVDGTAYTSGGTFTTISNNADLSNLSLSSGILTPVFASATTTYTASVANATPSITVTPTLAQANATLAVRINAGTFVAVSSGSSSSALPLNLGTNPIELRVTAQDGVTQKTYTVTVTRLALVLNPTISGWADVPVTLDGFVATGTLLGTVNLGFAPVPHQELLLVNNTGAGAISGTFTGLAEGATLTTIYGGNTFNFRISYAGGDGNDITLTRVAGAGQVSSSWAHLAGSIGGPGSQDASAALASFYGPNGVAVDSAGNVYVADTNNHTIRKVTPAGDVTTLAGSPGLSGSTDGTGSAARFNNPSGVTVDTSGNVYVADTYNDTIRKVTPAGVVTTLAGSAGSRGSTDGTGSSARFYRPLGVAVDSAGNVYVADAANHTIRKVTQGGVVTTLAGTALTSGSTDGMGSAARFRNPRGVAVDSAGNVYVADTNNHTIRKVTPAGDVTTLAGGPGLSGSTDGTGSAARYYRPSGVAVDSAGNVYVADYNNHTIRKVTQAGVVTTLAGAALTSGSTDGTGSAARFSNPWGVAVDSAGNVYVGDSWNHTIRKVTPAGVVTTLAGTALTSGSTDGAGSAARFNSPQGVAVDSAGNVYVADTYNHTIRKVTPAGDVTTLAGSAGLSGSTDGTGSAARFNTPSGVAVDNTGNVYVADTYNRTIRKVTPAGDVTTLAGSASLSGSTDGTGSAARFNNPVGVAVDTSGNVYVADTYNHTIRKVTPAGVVTTLAGSAGLSGSTDGAGSAARFNSPQGVAVDNSGNVYVADTYNRTIRKVTPAGGVSTLAGSAGSWGSTNGTGSAARFNYPSGVAVDSAGNVYVADTNNHTIRMVTPAGVVTTIGGLAGYLGWGAGYGSAARFSSPRGMAVSATGRIYVTDANSRVAQGELPGFRPILTQGDVSGLGVSSVTLNGTVNPNGFVTTASFEYGTTQSYGSSASVTLGSASGTTAQNVSTGLTGLSSGTLYYYRLTATNIDGTTSTTGGTFTTSTPSTNTDLSNLTLSSGSLNQAFTSAIISYTAGVANTTTSITVTPTLAQADATISVRINGGSYAAVTSGSSSGELPLAIGSNTIEVRVTAQDGVTTQTYTITITRAPSAVATLANLETSAGSLSPAFTPGVTSYEVSAANTTTSATVTPTLTDNTAVVRVNGSLLESGTSSTSIPLVVGANAVDVRVTAQDGTTIQAYTLTITRVPSAVSTLSGLSLSSGTLSPAFSGSTTSYSSAVANSVSSLKVTPKLTDATATVKVNGVPTSPGTASASIPLVVGTNTISVLVTAQDGTTNKAYTIKVTRAKSSDATLSGLVVKTATLSPAFKPAKTAYSATVPLAVKSVKIKATATSTAAKIKINGIAVASGTLSKALPLALGKNLIKIAVTAQDGTTKTYKLTITRSASAKSALADKTLETAASKVTVEGLRYQQLTVVKPTPGFICVIEVSPDLINWSSGDRHTTIVQDDDRVLTVRDNMPVKPGSKRFIRVRP